MTRTWLMASLLGMVLAASVVAFGGGAFQSDAVASDATDQSRLGTLVAAPSMSVARAAHTATTLPDGRVLIAGGFVEGGRAQGAELYDADVARSSPLPAMITARFGHTATVLPDGKVLLAGGYGEGSTTLASAELFDPATDTFVPTGSLRAARGGHVAVALLDGKVLIAGGVGPGWNFLESAELYDPARGEFSPTGAMSVARESHVGTRLADGRVLVTGGHLGRRAAIRIHASAEIYDPARGDFSGVGDMRRRRHKHDAVLLPDDRVLITAGADERDGDGKYDASEIFDPQHATFADGPTLKLPRFKHAGSSVLLPSGGVLIAGGSRKAEMYDIERRRFAVVPGEVELAGEFSAVALLSNGSVLITGGYGNGDGARSAAWLYTPPRVSAERDNTARAG